MSAWKSSRVLLKMLNLEFLIEFLKRFALRRFKTEPQHKKSGQVFRFHINTKTLMDTTHIHIKTQQNWRRHSRSLWPVYITSEFLLVVRMQTEKSPEGE